MNLALLHGIAAGEALGDDWGGDLGLEGSLKTGRAGDARSAEDAAVTVSIIPMALDLASDGRYALLQHLGRVESECDVVWKLSESDVGVRRKSFAVAATGALSLAWSVHTTSLPTSP